MNRTVIILFSILLCGCGGGHGQKDAVEEPIASREAAFEDYVPLLEKAGYKVYSFDISGLADSLKTLVVDVREYEYGKRTNYRGGYVNFANMRMISDFPEMQQEQILAEGRADDPERGIYRLAKKMNLAFYPGKDESQIVLTAYMEGQGESSWILPLRPISGLSKRFDGQYLYGYRPFALDSFDEDKFIPLVMYGSFWDDGTIVRFCGENELPSDMSSSMMKHMPHYYVVGVTISDYL